MVQSSVCETRCELGLSDTPTRDQYSLNGKDPKWEAGVVVGWFSFERAFPEIYILTAERPKALAQSVSVPLEGPTFARRKAHYPEDVTLICAKL